MRDTRDVCLIWHETLSISNTDSQGSFHVSSHDSPEPPQWHLSNLLTVQLITSSNLTWDQQRKERVWSDAGCCRSYFCHQAHGKQFNAFCRFMLLHQRLCYLWSHGNIPQNRTCSCWSNRWTVLTKLWGKLSFKAEKQQNSTVVHVVEIVHLNQRAFLVDYWLTIWTSSHQVLPHQALYSPQWPGLQPCHALLQAVPLLPRPRPAQPPSARSTWPTAAPISIPTLAGKAKGAVAHPSPRETKKECSGLQLKLLVHIIMSIFES